MAKIHFLNVKEGDCSVIQHNSDRVSVIDVCNASSSTSSDSQAARLSLKLESESVGGNFHQKKHPVNPIEYLQQHGVTSIFRYIQTHPDMDHMDGIKALFEEFNPTNMWDTDNNKEIDDSSWNGSPYDAADWKYYRNKRDTKPSTDPRRLALLAGAQGEYWNSTGGDGIHILAPTKELVDAADDTNDYNKCSYVLLYRTGENRIVFGGDSHDETWDFILANYESDVKDIDLLIAPHHGRDSGRSYEFLDVLTPSLTFFGNAPSEHLAYDAWRRRDLKIVTNNQANCMVVDASQNPMDLYVTNEKFARRVNASTKYVEEFQAWYAYPIEK